MPRFITIPGFKGGLASSLFDPLSKQTYQTAKNLDVYSQSNILTPLDVFSTVINPTVSGGTDVLIKNVYHASDGEYYFIGSATISATNNLVLWSTPVAIGSTLGATPTYTTVITAVASTPSAELEEFKDHLYFGFNTTLKKLTTTATTTSFTVTIASPGVFTATTHGFAAGDAVKFATTGALPTGLTAGTIYYVISAGLTADAFEVATTVGGSAVNTSGTQSGSHTIVKSTKTVSSSLTSLGPMRTHNGLGKVFFGNGSAVGWYDGTTLSLTTLDLNTDETVVGIEPWGRFVIVGIKDTTGSKKARFLIWDGSATTVDDIVNTGEAKLLSFNVVGNEIRAQFGDTLGFRISAFPIGGKPETDISVPLTITSGSVAVNSNAINTNKDLTVFGLAGFTYSIDQVLWAYGSGSDKEDDFLTQYRTVLSGATTAIGFLAIKDFNGQLVIIYEPSTNGTPVIQATKTSSNLNSQGVYESNVFHFNPVFKGRVKNIQIRHKELPASTGFTVKVKEIGKYTDDGTPPAAPSFTTALAQTTDNTTRTTVKSIDGTPFNWCDAFQIQITFDTISTTNAASIIFPITIEIETNEQVLR